MRIAFMHRQLRGGGTEADLRRMASGLIERGHSLHLFCARADAEVSGAVVHRVPVVRGGRVARLLSFAWMAPKLASRADCDVVVGFGRTPRQDLVRVGGGTHLSYLARMEAAGLRSRARGPYHRAILRLERQQFAPSGHRRVLAVSRMVRDEIVADYRVPASDVRVVYNGVDLDRFRPWADRAHARRELGQDEGPLCVAIGTGFVRKGFDLLLRLWSDDPPPARLVVIGDDERLGRYQARASETGGRVQVLGPRPDVERWLAAADLLIAPSRQEAFGNVVLEACAAGVPVVTSRRSGASELLDAPLTELVVDDPEDLSALGAAVRRGLGPDHRRFGGAARELAERHPWERHLEELDALLHEVAGAG